MVYAVLLDDSPDSIVKSQRRSVVQEGDDDDLDRYRCFNIRMMPTTARPTPTMNRRHGLAAGLSASMKNATTANAKPAMTRSQAKACFTRGPSVRAELRGWRIRLPLEGAGRVGRARATRFACSTRLTKRTGPRPRRMARTALQRGHPC